MRRSMKRFMGVALILVVAFTGSAYGEKRNEKTNGTPVKKPPQAEKEGRMKMGPPPEGAGQDGPFSIESLTRMLDLNESQKVRMKPILSEYRKEQILKDAQIQVAELDLSELVDESTPDLDKIAAKNQEIGTLQAGLRFFRIKKLLETKSFLSAEQYSKLKNFTGRMSGGPPGPQMRGGMGGMRGGPHGMNPGMDPGDRPRQGKSDRDEQDGNDGGE